MNTRKQATVNRAIAGTCRELEAAQRSIGRALMSLGVNAPAAEETHRSPHRGGKKAKGRKTQARGRKTQPQTEQLQPQAVAAKPGRGKKAAQSREQQEAA